MPTDKECSGNFSGEAVEMTMGVVLFRRRLDDLRKATAVAVWGQICDTRNRIVSSATLGCVPLDYHISIRVPTVENSFTNFLVRDRTAFWDYFLNPLH